MPEIVTKYPEVVMTILNSAGAKCGVNAKQNLLTTCDPSKFCAMPRGEFCVFGLKDTQALTQITQQDLQLATSHTIFGVDLLTYFMLTIAFAGGFLTKTIFGKKNRK